MSYRIAGLSPDRFQPLYGLPDADLAAQGVVRVSADASPGYPCRITLEDAAVGETLLLLSHAHHPVATPYRSAYAIYVREGASVAAEHVGTLPPVFATRTLAIRGFDAGGMIRDAVLVPPGEAERGIEALFAQPAIAYLHAFNATYGCFAARIDRE